MTGFPTAAAHVVLASSWRQFFNPADKRGTPHSQGLSASNYPFSWRPNLLPTGPSPSPSSLAAAMVGAPFARLLANLVVMGTGVLGRAFVEAYKQALQSARRQSAP